MEKRRKRLTAEEKAKSLRRHLVDKVPVSEVCEGVRDSAHGVLPLAEADVRGRGGAF